MSQVDFLTRLTNTNSIVHCKTTICLLKVMSLTFESFQVFDFLTKPGQLIRFKVVRRYLAFLLHNSSVEVRLSLYKYVSDHNNISHHAIT